MFQARHVEPALCQPDIRAGREVQVLAVLIEDRILGVAQAIGNLLRSRLVDRIYEHSAKMVGKQFCVGYPLAVRRPGWVQISVWRIVSIGVNLRDLAGGYVYISQVQTLVDVCDLPAVGGPNRRIEIRRRIAQVDVLRRSSAVLFTNLQFVLAGLIGKIADPLPVRRPGRIAIGYRGTVSQIPDVAFVGGNSKDFAPSFYDGAHARRRQSEIVNALRLDLHKLGAQLR